MPFLWAVLFVSLGAVAYGLSTLIGHGIFPWAIDGLKQFVIFSIVVLSGLWLVAQKLPRYLNSIATVFAAIFCIGAMGIAPLVTVVWIGLSSLLVGRLFTDKIIRLSKSETILAPLELLVGLGFYATIISLAAHFKINYPIVYATLLALPVILTRKTIAETFANINAAFFQQDTFDSPFLKCFAWYFAFTYLVIAAMPETGFDALAMHLMIPAFVEHHHVWTFNVEHYVWAVFPMNGDWLFSLAYMLAGEFGARLLNVGLLGVISWLLWSFVASVGSKKYGLLAVILFLSLPISLLETGSLFVENAWAAFLFGAFIALIGYIQTNRKEMLLFCGLFVGFALATKLTTILMLPWLAIILAWHQYQKGRSNLNGKSYLGAILAAVALGCIPYICAYIKTGNPIFPLYNAVFKSPYYDSTINFAHPIFEQGLSSNLLYLMTFESSKYLEGTAGSIGFYFLALLPVAIIISVVSRNKVMWMTALVGLGFFATVFANASYLRYVYPVMPLLVAVLVLAGGYLQNLSVKLKSVFGIVMVGSIALNLLYFNAANWNHREFPVHIIFDNAKKSQYILEQAPIRSAVEYLNALPKPPTSVAFFSQPVIAGLHVDALMHNWYNSKFSIAVTGSSDSSSLASILNENNATLMVVDENMADKRLLAMLQEISTPTEKFGNVSVRSLRREFLYKKEQLTNPDFDSLDGWSITSGAQFQASNKTAIVTVTNPIAQTVKVKENGRYLLEVTAKCQGNGEFRLQVNWLDESGKFISTDIDVATCSANFATKTKEVVAPSNARIGIVYGTSHNQAPVEIKRISFKN